jgi:predicted nucleic acid-binding Zn ribbon protein
MRSNGVQAKKYTSEKPRNKILGMITPRRAEDLLTTWANLTTPDQIKRMRRFYSDVVGSLLTDQDLLEMRDDIRLAWDAQDRRHRDWYLFLLRLNFQHNVVIRDTMAKTEPADPFRLEARFKAIPALTPFEAAIVHFQNAVADRAKHCSSPVCGDPYFIAVKRWQKFCSEQCAGPANRESKRKWWQEHGKRRAS